MPFCLNKGREKSLSRETCRDIDLRNKNPVQQPVFCKQAAELTKELINLINRPRDHSLCRVRRVFRARAFLPHLRALVPARPKRHFIAKIPETDKFVSRRFRF